MNRLIQYASLRPTPWKNGGGVTTELAMSPPGAGLDNFDWRVSLASIAEDGPFSQFPGVDRTLVMVAGDGYTQTVANGDRFVVMLDGRRYEGKPGSAEYRVMEFERYAVRIETREAQGVEVRPHLLTVDELLAAPTPPNMAEFAFRVGLPIAALNLALLAIPLSFVNPRAGRATNLLMALLIYLTYSNLLSITQAWVAQGKLSFASALWWLHGAMFLLLAVLFAWRIYANVPRTWLNR